MNMNFNRPPVFAKPGYGFKPAPSGRPLTDFGGMNASSGLLPTDPNAPPNSPPTRQPVSGRPPMPGLVNDVGVDPNMRQLPPPGGGMTATMQPFRRRPRFDPGNR